MVFLILRIKFFFVNPIQTLKALFHLNIIYFFNLFIPQHAQSVNSRSFFRRVIRRKPYDNDRAY